MLTDGESSSDPEANGCAAVCVVALMGEEEVGIWNGGETGRLKIKVAQGQGDSAGHLRTDGRARSCDGARAALSVLGGRGLRVK